MTTWRKILRGRPVSTIARIGAVLRWGLRALLVFLILDFFFLAITWPDWQRLAAGPVPKSAFMSEYQHEQAQGGQPTRIRWLPVSLANIPKHLQRAVILAEDSRFYEHSGFDLIAFKEAMDYNLSEGRLAIGASTISQQTVKNLFLSSSKNPLRKWHELILTWGMERHLGKQRILELYLNIAEFGAGVYGVQAAAQAYWGINAGQLNPRQAAELAAALPSPLKNNPATRTPLFEKRVARILRLLVHYPGDAAESLVGWQAPPDAADDAAAGVSPGRIFDDDESDATGQTQAPAPIPGGEAPAPEQVSPLPDKTSPAPG